MSMNLTLEAFRLFYLCAVVRCPRLPRSSHSVQSGCGFGSMNNVFGDRCFYYCDIGYRKINGSSERACQANGTWSGQPPYCEGDHKLSFKWLNQLSFILQKTKGNHENKMRKLGIRTQFLISLVSCANSLWFFSDIYSYHLY